MRSCSRTQRWPFYGGKAFKANWKSENSSLSGCLMSWLQIKKKKKTRFFEVLFYFMQQWTCLFGLWHATISGIYMTTGNDQLSGWTKKELQSISQSQTCTKKRSWSLFGDLLPIWSTTAFWIPATSLHLRSMLSKSMRCTKICSKHWSTERTQFFSRITPYHTSHN